MPYPSRATRRRVVLAVGRLQDDARIALRMAQRVAADGGIIEFECPSGRLPSQTQTATECQRDRTCVYLAEVASVERRLAHNKGFPFLQKNSRARPKLSHLLRNNFQVAGISPPLKTFLCADGNVLCSDNDSLLCMPRATRFYILREN